MLPLPAPSALSVSSGWTFLSNHAHVLVCVARDPDVRIRDVAALVGITERSVQLILRDLAEAGVIERERSGRRNRYLVHPEHTLRHSLEAHRTVGELLALVARPVAAAVHVEPAARGRLTSEVANGR